MFFTFRYWLDAFYEGLQLFGNSSNAFTPAIDSTLTNKSKTAPTKKTPPNQKVATRVGKGYSRAPRGGQALVRQVIRTEQPNTPGRGRRNGSRK